MTFLITINCVMLYGLWAFFHALRLQPDSPPLRRTGAIITFLGTTAMCAAIFLPVFASHFVPDLGMKQWTPKLLLAGSIATGAGCSMIFLPFHSSRTRLPFEAAALAALAGSVYLAFTAVDHLYFFHDRERTGYVDASIAAEANIRCEHGFVLVKLDDADRAATYRCPNNVVFGDPLDQPFIPWPAYRQGVSAELGLALRRLGARTSSKRQE